MLNHWFKCTTSWIWSKKRIEIGLIQHWSFGALIQSKRLCLEDVSLHFIKVDIVIEFYDVDLRGVLVLRIKRNLYVNP